MPFTGSHPAAVLPLLRLGLVPSALVVGSMVPDAPYYLPLPFGPAATHSLWGVFSLDLLTGLLVFLLWQALLAPAAVALAPPAARARLAPAAAGELLRYCRTVSAMLLVAVSVTAGAATHVLWDEFTHAGRWGARHLSWLSEQQGPLPGYRWAQFASGVLGALVLAAWLIRWWRRTPPVNRHEPPGVSAGARSVAVTVIVLAGLVGSVVGGLLPSLDSDESAARLAVERGGTASTAATVVVAVLVVMRRRPKAGPGGQALAAHRLSGRRRSS